jgi:tetrapyrrole methylase family protein/MazG family protein
MMELMSFNSFGGVLMKKEKYEFSDLLDIMRYLRGDDGCPWDKVQTHESIKKYLIEEAYEVMDTIGGKDEKFCEELGDLLLQIIFHSQIAQERGSFDVHDVINVICKKLVSRHRHVFGDVVADSPEEVIKSWDEIKKGEKGLKSHTENLEDVPKAFPGLMRSYEVQKRAAKVGFDWDNIGGAFEKLKEEVGELEEATKEGNIEHIEEEVGDMFFAMVNVSRFLKVQPEMAVSNTIKKFINRFRYIENKSNLLGKDLNDMNLVEMDAMWDEAKKDMC